MQYLSTVNNQYEFFNSNSVKFDNYEIDHLLYSNFYKNLFFLNKQIFKEEVYKDDFWTTFLSLMHQFKNEIALLPMSFNSHYTSKKIEKHEYVKRYIEDFNLKFPDFSERVNNILNLFEQLIQSSENPYLEKISQIVENNNNSKILLIDKDNKLEASQRKNVSSICKNINIMSYREWKKSNLLFDISIFLSKPSWYDYYLLDANKSMKIIFLSYSCIKNRELNELNFDDCIWSNSIKPKNNKEEQSKALLSPEDEIENIEFEKYIEQTFIINEIYKNPNIEHTQKTTCIAIELGSGETCFLRNDSQDHSQHILIIDESDSKKHSIKSRNVEDINIGDFVVLTTHSSGDEIIERANKIIGQESTTYRDIQFKWKNHFKMAIEDTGGIESVSKFLEDQNISISKETIKGWAMNEKRIRPQKYGHFEAIMKLCNIPNHTEEWWKAIETIDRAHIIAGKQANKQLEKIISVSDITNLIENKFQKFKLEDSEVEKGVYEVVKKSSEILEMPVGIMDKPIESN